MELEKARAIALELRDQLDEACHRIEIAGDIRHAKPRVRKIKLLCIPKPMEGVAIPEFEPFNPDAWRQEIEEFGDQDAVDDWFIELFQEGLVDGRRIGRTTFNRGEKCILHVPSGMAVDILSTDEERWAVALVVATGGVKTIRRIAAAARERGWRFRRSGDGFDTPDGHVTCDTEREVFEAVGLPYMPPEQRE